MRYIPNSPEEREEMLATVGLESADELFRSIPKDVQLGRPLNITDPLAESEVIGAMETMAAKNTAATKPSFLGAGVYSHFSPTIVDHLIQRSEFFTSYTPYQPEISQGTLQYIFEFQTLDLPAHWNGGRERLDVRRLDRDGRGLSDGPARHATRQDRRRRKRSSGISRGRTDIRSARRRRDRRRSVSTKRPGRVGELSSSGRQDGGTRRPVAEFLRLHRRPYSARRRGSRRRGTVRRRRDRSDLVRPAQIARARAVPTSSSAKASRWACR